MNKNIKSVNISRLEQLTEKYASYLQQNECILSGINNTINKANRAGVKSEKAIQEFNSILHQFNNTLKKEHNIKKMFELRIYGVIIVLLGAKIYFARVNNYSRIFSLQDLWAVVVALLIIYTGWFWLKNKWPCNCLFEKGLANWFDDYVLTNKNTKTIVEYHRLGKSYKNSLQNHQLNRLEDNLELFNYKLDSLMNILPVIEIWMLLIPSFVIMYPSLSTYLNVAVIK